MDKHRLFMGRSATSCHISSRMSSIKLQDSKGLLAAVDTFVFDCDGVIWKGSDLINGAADVIKFLRDQGKTIFFVTNNSAKSRAGFLEKFIALGLDVRAEEVLCSSYAAAAYLVANPLPAGQSVYVIGQQGICDELALAGIPYIGGPADAGKVADLSPSGTVEHSADIGAVVVGFDPHISFYKIQYAQLCINENKDCRFIATNLDATAHLTSAQEWAEAGAMVGAIKGCTGVEPILVGKPASLLIDHIATKCGTPRARMCMVGDRLDTDVLFGQQNGLLTVLTLSGVTSEQTLLSGDNTIRPTYYVDSIKDFLN